MGAPVNGIMVSWFYSKELERSDGGCVLEQEKYLGGFDSIQIRKGLFAGYGVYATNLRVFGVKRRRAAEPLEIGSTSSDSAQIIRDLEQRRDFEVKRENIESVEMQKPPGIFRMGHLKITLKSGQTLEIKVGKKREYEKLRDVMINFDPEIVRSN